MGNDMLKGSPAPPAPREVYNLGNKDPVTVTYMIECLEFPVGKYRDFHKTGVKVRGQS